MDAAQLVAAHLRGGAAVRELLAASHAGEIAALGGALAETLLGGGKLLLCGNGGSAADAQHLAAELVGQYKATRRALPALALTTDSSVLTAVSNDRGYEQVFARQVEALAAPGDAVLGISTSGRSPNVDAALRAARALGARPLALLGKGGGATAGLAELAVVVPSDDTQYVQECHIAIGHILCELVERALAGAGA